MAKKVKVPYFVKDERRKILTLDMSVEPTVEDEKFVNLLIASGKYDVRMKSAEKARIMKARAKKQPTKADIQKALANDAEKLAMFEAICEMKNPTESYNGNNGFLAARSWYLHEVKAKEEEAKKK